MTVSMILTVYISGCIFFGVFAGIFGENFGVDDNSFAVFLLSVCWPMIFAVGVAWGVIFVSHYIGQSIRRGFTK